jgi:hypothetical protein
VGPKQLHPLTLTVRERELAVEAKLAALKPSADHISKQVDDPAPPLPAHMKGTVQLSLVANGARTATFALGLADLIDIRDPEQGLVIRTQAIDPDLSVLNVHLDGETRKLEASTRLGQTEIVFPLADRRQRPGAPDVRIFLPGVHGQGEFELDSQNIIFKDLGLGVGTTTVEVRGQRIFQVNLNPQDNWRFDAQVTFNQHDLPRIAITPRLDLQMMWKLMLIEADLASPPPPELRDMNFNLLIDALAGRPPVLEAIPDPLGGPDPRLKVVSGKLQLFSSTVITPVTAQAGQCLVPREPAPGEHPVLGAVSVTTCQ